MASIPEYAQLTNRVYKRTDENRTPQALLVAANRISAEFVTVASPLTFPPRVTGFTSHRRAGDRVPLHTTKRRRRASPAGVACDLPDARNTGA